YESSRRPAGRSSRASPRRARAPRARDAGGCARTRAVVSYRPRRYWSRTPVDHANVFTSTSLVAQRFSRADSYRAANRHVAGSQSNEREQRRGTREHDRIELRNAVLPAREQLPRSEAERQASDRTK